MSQFNAHFRNINGDDTYPLTDVIQSEAWNSTSSRAICARKRFAIAFFEPCAFPTAFPEAVPLEMRDFKLSIIFRILKNIGYWKVTSSFIQTSPKPPSPHDEKIGL